MNERIRELSEQAEKYADDNFRGESTWSEAFESKFAELIVWEVLDVIENEQFEIYPPVLQRVKEHFGVEE
jgi:hypothetical protein